MAERMEDQQQAEKFALLQGARRPEIPFKPVRHLWISEGCLAGFMVSPAIAAIREMRTGTLLGEWELPSERAVLGRAPFKRMDSTLGQTQGLETGCNGNGGRRWCFVGRFSRGRIATAFYQGWMKL